MGHINFDYYNLSVIDAVLYRMYNEELEYINLDLINFMFLIDFMRDPFQQYTPEM